MRGFTAIAGLLVAFLCPAKAVGQEHLAIRSDVLFYGDNTEFRNLFREGETTFGAALRVAGGLIPRVLMLRRLCAREITLSL